MIQVDTWPTLPSALGLSFLSEITDKKQKSYAEGEDQICAL